MLVNLISHTLIHPVGKIKIETFHAFDIHWLYRTSRYAIIKADVTEKRNDITKRHDIVITIWRTVCNRSDCMIKKNYFSEMNGMQEKRIYHECEGQIEKSVPRDHSLTSLGKPCDARQSPSGQIFLPYDISQP